MQKKSSSIMMLVAVTGKGNRFSPAYVANYANVYVLDALKRVPGAGQAQIMGVPDQAMRIWMNPDRMASLSITTSDIANAINTQNALFGAGQVGQQPNAGAVELTFPVVTQSQFSDPRQYLNIILRGSQDGSAIVRLGDVARAEVGLRQYIIDSKLDDSPATFIAVYQQPGANGLAVSAAVRKALEDMKSRFPDGLDYVIALDTNDFVRLSIEEVLKTLVEALVLVVLVVYLFLQSLRTTFICAVAIVVALVASFTGMLALGFSINLLTLFGLILAIGMVVDDAIVVVENVERNMAQHHLGPKEATLRSMEEIGSSLVAVVLVMASVFVPAAFLPGTTGQLYKQFAVTIVISVSVSGFIALTLTPAMCALLLKHNPPPTRGFFAWFNRQVDRVTRGFGHAVEFVIRRMVVAFVLLGVFLWGIWHLFHLLPTSFVPQEDQGYAMVAIIMPQSASLDRTQAVAERVDAMLAKIPGVARRSMITGYSLIDGGYKTNAATFFVTFKDFKERYASVETAREQNARAILLAFYDEAKHIEEAVVLPIAPPAIPGIGTTGGFEFWIQDTAAGSPVELEAQTRAFLARARERPELAALNTTFNASAQQLRADVDRDKATLLGIPVQDVYSAIQAQFGSLTASQFSQFSRVWWVIVQSDAQVSPAARGPHPALHPVEPGQDGAAVGGGEHAVDGGPRHPAALQRLSRGQDHRQPVAGSQLGAGDRGDGGARPRAAAGLLVRLERARVRGEEVRRHVVAGVRVRPDHRVPGAGRAVRVVDPAGRGDDGDPVRRARRAADQLDSRARERRLFPDRPAGADRARREERRAARVGGGRFPQAGQVDHGGDGARRRAAAAADHHDVAGLRRRLPAARPRAGRGRQRAALDRHRHHRRHARRDHAGDALRAAVLLHLRPAGRAQEGTGCGRRARWRSRRGAAGGCRRRGRHRRPWVLARRSASTARHPSEGPQPGRRRRARITTGHPR